MLFEVVLIAVVFLIFNWIKMKPFYWRKKGVPCDIPLPIFGNAAGSFFDTFHGYWGKKYQRIRKYGTIYGTHNFGKLALIVSDPEVLKEMLVNQSDNFLSRGIHTNPSYDITARNVFFVTGQEWKRIRSKLSPYFSPMRLKNLTQMMSVNMKEYSSNIEDAALHNRQINFNELSLKLATDVVVNTIFGIKPDSFTNPKSFFFGLQEEIFGFSFVLKILIGTVTPWIYDLFSLTVIPSTTTQKLQGFVHDVFDQRNKNIGVRQDFIQGMLDLVKKESHLDIENMQKFTMEDATSQCMVMYMGGTETTGNSISYLLHELAFHQEIQNKVRDEIKLMLAKTEDGHFSYDHLYDLKYTNMTINECLRKYPIVPVVSRECTRATTIADVDIEVGTGIFIPIMAIHYDPEYYPEPEKFKPERFADETYKDNSIFMPFGLGPRTCIGWKMAIIEMTFALCEVLPKYRILPGENSKKQIDFNWKPTLNPQNGIWLKVEKIKPYKY